MRVGTYERFIAIPQIAHWLGCVSFVCTEKGDERREETGPEEEQEG
jgi:hypothetical protein